MANRKFGGTRYWVMGILWWLVIAGVLGVLHHVAPGWLDAPEVVASVVIGVVVAGFVLVYVFRPKP